MYENIIHSIVSFC